MQQQTSVTICTVYEYGCPSSPAQCLSKFIQCYYYYNHCVNKGCGYRQNSIIKWQKYFLTIVNESNRFRTLLQLFPWILFILNCVFVLKLLDSSSNINIFLMEKEWIRMYSYSPAVFPLVSRARLFVSWPRVK